jgi:cystathionine beta-synthase
MKDNGFLDAADLSGAVRDLLLGKRKLHFSHKGEKIDAVVRVMKEHGISQMPVCDEGGAAVGMIHEVDLLHGLLDGRIKSHDPLDSLVAPLQGVVTPETPLAKLQEIFAEDNVAVVLDGKRPVGIITKIDYIDFLGQRLR